jgi:hypothetical protein
VPITAHPLHSDEFQQLASLPKEASEEKLKFNHIEGDLVEFAQADLPGYHQPPDYCPVVFFATLTY